MYDVASRNRGKPSQRSDKAAARAAAKTAAKEAAKSATSKAKAAALEQIAEHMAEQMANAVVDHVSDRLAGHLGALDVWTRGEAHGRRPRFTRDDLAATAVRIADAEGIDAVSMRHLASELGAGTMTLYHYVRTKDELLTLVVDTIMAEVVVPTDEPLPEDWREALTIIAVRSRDAMRRHAWMLDITDDPPFGPNAVRHFDQTLQAVSTLDVPLQDKFDIVSCVDEYVFGFCLHERNNLQTQEPFTPEVRAYVGGLIATGAYPQLSRLVDEHGLEGLWTKIGTFYRDDGRFERNLARLLDGIEASRIRSSKAPHSAGP